VRKEWFIVSHTNSKTKKVLIGLLNQTNQPIAIVNAQQEKVFLSNLMLPWVAVRFLDRFSIAINSLKKWLMTAWDKPTYPLTSLS